MHSQVNAGSERRKLASTMTPIDEMRQAYRLARQAEPRARHREIAAARGVSEGELIAAHVGANPDGLTARRLMPCWASLLRAMPQLGTVMCLTRNEHCVHEKVGRFEDVQIAADDAPMGLVLGPDIDLRIFFRTWAHAFAVQEPRGADGALQSSVQFFDAAGHAVHKVFARPQTDGRAWQALIDSHAADDQVPGMLVAPTAAPTPERADDEVDVAALRQDWAAMQDTHEFFGLLRRHGVSRTQAVRLADPALALKLANNAVRVLLQAAASGAVPIMVFVGNPGMIQIHTGPIQRVEVIGPWLNVLDPGFNLHLREDRIAQTWLVRKPTADGIVTSLEIFDADGQTIAMMFGERKPGKPELDAWRQLTAQVANDPAWNASGQTCT